MLMIGLSSSYFAFQKFSVYNAVKRIHELGFETAELGAAHTFEKGIFQTLKKIKKDFSEMHFTLHGLFPPLPEKHWFNLSLGLTAQNKKILAEMFKAAEEVEAVCVTVHPGYLSEAFFGEPDSMHYPKNKGKPIPKEKALEGCFSAAEFALELAEKSGIGFGIEVVPDSHFKPAIYSADDFREFFSRLPKAGLLLDMGHALSEGRLEEMLQFKEKIVQMHVHYSRANTFDEHKPIPSEEAVSFMKTIPQIKKIPLIFEHGTNVSEQQILTEKKLLEGFLAKA
ncbi:MAG TPA: sugar phosphate isomerase/epimerase [archaeon]|nr:sugar phosphate isomerase/epimerase [archaeon]